MTPGVRARQKANPEGTLRCTTLRSTPPAPKSRRASRALQRALARQGLDAALILQKTDLFYFSGTIQQATLYVPAAGEPILMVNRNFERGRAESPLDRVVPLPSPSRIPAILQAAGLKTPAALGFELDVLPVNLFRKYCDSLRGRRAC